MNGTGDAVVQARNGRTPIRWGGPAPEQADPTGGRHAFDAEAALTPIFTTLRRGDWREDPQPAPRSSRPLWPVPDQVERFHDDPWTAEIPVVPPLHAVPDGGYGAAPADLEMTTTWRVVDGPHVPQPAVGGSRWDAAGYDAPGYDTAGYDPAGYDTSGYSAGYDVPAYQRGGHDPAAYEPYGSYEPLPYEPLPYGRRPYDPNRYDPSGYDPVRDTGRHHVRLAPAGW